MNPLLRIKSNTNRSKTVWYGPCLSFLICLKLHLYQFLTISSKAIPIRAYLSPEFLCLPSADFSFFRDVFKCFPSPQTTVSYSYPIMYYYKTLTVIVQTLSSHSHTSESCSLQLPFKNSMNFYCWYYVPGAGLGTWYRVGGHLTRKHSALVQPLVQWLGWVKTKQKKKIIITFDKHYRVNWVL